MSRLNSSTSTRSILVKNSLQDHSVHDIAKLIIDNPGISKRVLSFLNKKYNSIHSEDESRLIKNIKRGTYSKFQVIEAYKWACKIKVNIKSSKPESRETKNKRSIQTPKKSHLNKVSATKHHIKLQVFMPNIDTSLETIKRRLKNYYDNNLSVDKKSLEVSNYHMLFVGPSGVGKSFIANILAESVGRKLLITTASEYFDKFHGETEKKIRKIIKKCEKEGLILFIDECEALLPDRSKSKNNWETSMVTEFLDALSKFKGICFAATNLPGSLDPAFTRRFSEKIKFDYLAGADLANHFIIKFSRILETPTLSPIDKAILNSLKNVSFGNCDTVYRRLFLDNRKFKASEIIHEIAGESKLNRIHEEPLH